MRGRGEPRGPGQRRGGVGSASARRGPSRCPTPQKNTPWSLDEMQSACMPSAPSRSRPSGKADNGFCTLQFAPPACIPPGVFLKTCMPEFSWFPGVLIFGRKLGWAVPGVPSPQPPIGPPPHPVHGRTDGVGLSRFQFCASTWHVPCRGACPLPVKQEAPEAAASLPSGRKWATQPPPPAPWVGQECVPGPLGRLHGLCCCDGSTAWNLTSCIIGVGRMMKGSAWSI